jgi:hypothetical protein
VQHLGVVQHREERIAVFLDFRALMAVAGVFDGELMQVEFLLHRGEFPGPRILERDPYETLRPAHVLADLLGLDVPELLSVLVGRAIDQHRDLLDYARNDKPRRLSRIG